MFGKKNKNQKKQWIIGFCGLLVIGVAGGMLAAKMTTSVSDTEKTAKDTAGFSRRGFSYGYNYLERREVSV